MEIDGARVLVTGGSRGIGKATARELVRRGARVAICARHVAALRATAEELGCLGIVADVSREDDVARLVRETIGGLGGYDVLVNNAAIGTFAHLVETDPADMERVWRVNVLGAFLVAKASAAHFVDQGRGHIVNVGSTAAHKGFEGGTAYASSKFALTGLTECWRAELRRHDVRVMQVDPSEVQTRFEGAAPSHNPTKLQAPDIAQAIVDLLAMPDHALVTHTTIWATNPR